MRILHEVRIDNQNGWGAVPHNQDVDYFGLRVKMRPNMFLKLARPLRGDDHGAIEDHISKGGAIGAPFFDISFPPEWDRGDFSSPARVVGHEGRNRMRAIRKLEGDVPIEVHLFFPGLRARHLTPEIRRQLNLRLIPEWSTGMIYDGPFFETF